MSEIIEREEGCVRDLEEGVKNKWRWSWLEIKDENGDYLSEYIRKIRQSGKAICMWCNGKQINYGASGFKALRGHATSKGHRQWRGARKGAQLLPSVFQAAAQKECAVPTPETAAAAPSTSCSSLGSGIPYGAPPNVHPATETCKQTSCYS
ncbi:uncharacterized protein LOC121416126 isoform X2 [Lytechinus variegatus]|uniref:uncharacterized protein LOC121416126 isoform X2 n=1 Tax=Lytechinus variegatus TaxID=7654 RepID=UPI001BB10CA4|nr:uncharacterized protein LOC121416126 isoform X2 [Lytechinus variegatus]